MRTARGVTLVELLIALGVSAIALSAAILASNAQERAYYSGSRLRAAQSSARSALLFIEQKLPLAGYGMDAPLAFDFQFYSPAAVGACPAQLAPCSSDRTNDSDELTFYARNPSVWVDPNPALSLLAAPQGHGWQIVDLSTSTVTIRGHRGDLFRKGQILQLVCAGLLQYAYFTLGETQPTLATGVANEGDPVSVTLVPVSAANPFLRQDVGMTLACMNSGATATAKDGSAKLFQIDRYRFHIRPVDLGGGRMDPFLMLDSGTDTDGNGVVDVNDEQFLAEGIESLQVGYVFAEPTLPAAGTVSGTAITFTNASVTPAGIAAQTITTMQFVSPLPVPAGQTAYAYSSFYPFSTVTIPAARKTNAQANIRRVLLSVVARSPEPDPTGLANMRYGVASQLLRLNQSAAPAWVTAEATARGGDDGYQRAVVESSVGLPNMLTRTISYF